jgi:hypothetical protein
VKLPWYLFLDILLWAWTILTICWALPKMDRLHRWSACSAAVTVMVLQTINEVVSRRMFNAWTFSFDHNIMIGVNFLGEPLEEYLFWWAYAWLIPFGYYGLVAWFGNQNQLQSANSKTSVQE